jgi:hypothetical protein
MDSLNTNDPIALSILINEELYFLNDIEPLKVENSTQEIISPVIEKPITLSAEAVKNLVSEPVSKPLSQPFYNYLGDNNKYLLVVVKSPNDEYLNSKELEFLLKILAAKKLELKDIAIINTEKYAALDFDQLKSYFALSKILTFGINPVSLNISGITANKTGTYKGVKVLGTWTLAQLDADVKKKTTYWNELKNF